MNPGMVWVRTGNNSTHKKTLEGQRAFYLLPENLEQSGDVVLPATTNAVGLVEEVFAVTERLLSVLVYGNRDGLDVLIAPPFAGR
jgi:hypothetical protein